MPADADSLGSYLRRERELRHVSLQDISATIKVQLKFLDALERNDYDQLPPAPFVAGFLRAYAQHLGLDPAEIVAAYHARHGLAEGLEGRRLLVTYPVKRSKRLRRTGIGVVVAAIILVAGLVWHTARWERAADLTAVPSRVVPEPPLQPANAGADSVRLTSDTPHPQGTDTSAASASVASQEATPSPRPREPEGPATVAATPEAPSASASVPLVSEPAPEETLPREPPAPLVVEAIALEDTWLRVDIDGAKRHSLLLTAGKSIQWEATERFVFTVGNAQGTRLVLNGHDVPLPPTQSNVVRDFVLTRNLVN
jgi:cytoskeleton protein RodZ